MNHNLIKEKLVHATTLIEECLVELGETAAKSKTQKVVITKEPSSLPEQVLALRSEGFFKTPQTSKEVHIKLQNVYYCEPDRVTVALSRLLGKKELRKTNKQFEGKRVVAYVW